MAYKYEKVDQKLLVPQIEDQLMIYIQQEQIAVGARLPSEHKLSEKFGVGRSTIRAALSLLAVSGWFTKLLITSYFFCSSIDKITFLISQFLRSDRMYKVLFYHKWDFFICGIPGLYHIWLILLKLSKKYYCKL